jgi:hypothetical protein
VSGLFIFDDNHEETEGVRMAITAPQTIYVHPDGNNTRNGLSVTKAKATLAGALAAAVSGRGDTIAMFPGSYTASPVTKDYVKIMGMIGAGYGKPDIAGELVVTGQGFEMKRVRVAATVARALIIRGNGFLIGGDAWDDQCVIDGITGQDCILLEGHPTDDSYTASEGRILKNLIRGGTNGIRFKNPGAGGNGNGPTDNLVMFNEFSQIVAQDIIDEHTAGGNNKTYYDCHAWNYHRDSNKAVYITLTNGTANRGTIGGQFAVDSAPLDSTMVAVAAGITVIDAKSSDGLVDTSAF